jgi:hypothetical protein
MAEINYNNLYNQLSPMEQRYYDQQFSKNYVPGQENIMLSSQPAYEQMKAAYEAEQQIPESSIFDSIFGSASAAEPPAIPNLTYRNITPTFDLATGITNTTAASPFINTADILNKYNVPNLRNQNLIDAIIAQNMQKNVSNFINAPQDYYPSDLGFINAPQDDYASLYSNQLPYSGIGTMRYETPRTIADQNKVLGQTFTEKKPSGIEKLLSYAPFGKNSILKRVLDAFPQMSPEAKNIRNFYGSRYGLTDTGQVASGIMKGYNPVYGGFLNTITGGRFGTPTQYGLANAARKRIERIAKRKAPQTEASRKKIKELQDIARADTISRARQSNPDVYSKADALGLTDSSGGFKSAGTNENFSNKTGRGRTGY